MTKAGADLLVPQGAIGVVLFAVAFVVNLTADIIVKGIKGKQND